MSSKTVDDFLDHVRKSAQDGTLVRLNLGASIQPDGIRNVFIRPVRLKDSSVLSFVYRHPTRDVTKNFSNDEAIDLLRDLLGQQFLNGFLSTTTGTAQLTFRKGRPTRMLLGKPEVDEVPNLAHDRAKPRPVPGHSVWLKELGVTTADGAVKAGMEAKFRQINRFVEVLQPLLVAAQLDPAAPLHLGHGLRQGLPDLRRLRTPFQNPHRGSHRHRGRGAARPGRAGEVCGRSLRICSVEVRGGRYCLEPLGLGFRGHGPACLRYRDR